MIFLFIYKKRLVASNGIQIDKFAAENECQATAAQRFQQHDVYQGEGDGGGGGGGRVMSIEILSIFFSSSFSFFGVMILKKYFKCSISVLAVNLASKSLFPLIEKNDTGSTKG